MVIHDTWDLNTNLRKQCLSV